MGQISSVSLKLLAEKNTATKNHSENLAGLKKFVGDETQSVFEKQQELQNSLEKLAQAAKLMQQ